MIPGEKNLAMTHNWGTGYQETHQISVKISYWLVVSNIVYFPYYMG